MASFIKDIVGGVGDVVGGIGGTLGSIGGGVGGSMLGNMIFPGIGGIVGGALGSQLGGSLGGGGGGLGASIPFALASQQAAEAQTEAAQRAMETQTAAAEKAVGTQQEFFNLGQAALQPHMDTGTRALGDLYQSTQDRQDQDEIYAQYKGSQQYKDFTEGTVDLFTKEANQRAAARGGAAFGSAGNLESGGAFRQGTRELQALQNARFGEYYNRDFQGSGQIATRLANIAGGGATAAGNLSRLSGISGLGIAGTQTGLGNAVAGIQTAQGTAAATGIAGPASVLQGGMANNVLGGLMQGGNTPGYNPYPTTYSTSSGGGGGFGGPTMYQQPYNPYTLGSM